MNMQELFSSPDSFTKNAVAVDSDGNEIGFNNPKAIAWCLVGATWKCYEPLNSVRVLDQINNYIRQRFSNRLSDWKFISDTIAFNNHPETTIDEVRQLVKELNI